MPERLAFIGLGIMGGPMAGHLLAAGHSVVVNTRSRARAESLIAKGATWAESPAAAASAADVVFVCVPDTPDVESFVLGSQGILSATRPGTIVVDHSTISPAATRTTNAALASRAAHLLDAPVSARA